MYTSKYVLHNIYVPFVCLSPSSNISSYWRRKMYGGCTPTQERRGTGRKQLFLNQVSLLSRPKKVYILSRISSEKHDFRYYMRGGRVESALRWTSTPLRVMNTRWNIFFVPKKSHITVSCFPHLSVLHTTVLFCIPCNLPFQTKHILLFVCLAANYWSKSCADHRWSLWSFHRLWKKSISATFC